MKYPDNIDHIPDQAVIDDMMLNLQRSISPANFLSWMAEHWLGEKLIHAGDKVVKVQICLCFAPALETVQPD